MTFSAVLLAGGESSRMGRDKATIVFQGRPLWERQLQILQELDLEKTFVSARTVPSWLPSGIEIILDEPPSRGPLSGLTKTLLSMNTTHLVVLAIDMPFMTSAAMLALCRNATAGCGVVPVIDGRAEPLAAVYPKEAIGELSTALAGRSFSLQPIVQKLTQAGKVRMMPIPKEERNLFRSVNEPADLEGI